MEFAAAFPPSATWVRRDSGGARGYSNARGTGADFSADIAVSAAPMRGVGRGGGAGTGGSVPRGGSAGRFRGGAGGSGAAPASS